MSAQTPKITSPLVNFGTNLLSSTATNPSEYTYNLENFDPSQIDLMNLPTTSGTFSVYTPASPSVALFSSGQYVVHNCTINDDDEIVEDSYTWNITNPGSQSDLKIVEFNISDSTACDYYYLPHDYYTPISSYPNSSLDSSSTVTVNYPGLLSALYYFNAIMNNDPFSRFGLFYVTVGASNCLYVLNDIYIAGIKISAGTSLCYLQQLEQTALASNSNLSSLQMNTLRTLKYIFNLATKMYELQNAPSQVILPISGNISTTVISGTELGLGLYPAIPTIGPNVGSSFLVDGSAPLLFVMSSVAINQYNKTLF
jgi:hypothetical protein